MSTLRSLFVFTSIFASTLFYGSQLLAQTNSTSRIIGDNDLVKIPASTAYLPMVQAIGRLKIGCTVTHVGNGIAITAGHCFASGKFKGVRKKLPCKDPRFSVRWGVTFDSEGYLTSQCTELIASEFNKEKDYAIFRVDNIPATSMELSTEAVEEKMSISIFSHPRMRPLEWSQWCTVEGFVRKSQNHQFYYPCDTEGGSSGAAVLNSNYQIVGVHNYYSGPLGRNGATLLSSTPLAQIIQDPHFIDSFNPPIVADDEEDFSPFNFPPLRNSRR